MIDVLLNAFLLSVVLLGIHSYYGLRIIERGIIFTDLAIGQMAAMGAAFSFLTFHGVHLYAVSLAFSLVGAVLIALSTRRTRSHEAFIGLLYAFGMSASVIVLSRAARGAEDMQRLLAADILFVSRHDVLKTAALYAAIGLSLLLLTRHARGLWQDLLFFATFSLTVTSSVNLAGVLVVFAILVAPAFIMSSIPCSFRARLVGAWIIGTVLNLLAIAISYFLDLPTGHTVVALYAFVAIVSALVLGKAGPRLPDPGAGESLRE